MSGHIIAMWRGQMPLSRAFWTFAVLFGTVMNLVATGLMFAAMAAGVPAGLALLFHFLPLPYNTLALVSVWRSASTYGGPRYLAAAAQLAAAVWFAAMIVM